MLWQDANAALQEGLFTQASLLLQRYVDRYPSTEHYMDALLLLGESYVESDKSKHAIRPLSQYIINRGNSTPGREARIYLGKAYLKSHMNHEALLTSLELMGFYKGELKKKEEKLYLSSLLLKSRSLIRLNKRTRASQTLVSFERVAQKNKKLYSSLLSESNSVAIELKLQNCALLPGKGRHTEGTVKSYLKMRGTCWLEAMVMFYKNEKTGHSTWSEDTAQRLADAFEQYGEACLNPPLPPGSRTAQELRTYKEELVNTLAVDYGGIRGRALDLLGTWKGVLPQSSRPTLDRLTSRIRSTGASRENT